jgi:hypothetical protein
MTSSLGFFLKKCKTSKQKLKKMGKRQIRIYEFELAEKLPNLLNIELNLVLKNDMTLHGKIIRVQNQKIQFKDSILRLHWLKTLEIAEIILDKTTEY